MLQPADIWALWGLAITAYLVGVVCWMQPAVRMCERGSAWWLLAPVFWPLATGLLVWQGLVRRRQAAAYRRLRAAELPVRLVPEGTPYGSPVSAGLAGELGVVGDGFIDP